MRASERKPIAQVQSALSAGGGGDRLPKRLRNPADELRAASSSWLRYRSIQGLSIGYKETEQRNTGIPCIKLLVERKQPRSKLRDPAPESLPRLDGKGEIPIDVEEVGRLWAHSGALFPGASLAHVERTAGTLGLVVRPRQESMERYLLSCRHVIAPFDLANPITAVRHPAPADGGNSSADDVAHFTHAYPRFLDSEGYPNLTDAALARLNAGVTWRNDPPVIGKPKGVGKVPKSGDFVRIYGRSSQFEVGQVHSSSANVRLRFRKPNGSSFRLGFAGQVECSRYARDGDSGSAVFDINDRVVGLHIGGSEARSFFSPIQHILDYFQVDLADPATDSVLADGSGQPSPGTAFLTSELTGSHNIFGSIDWSLTDQGLKADGRVETTSGQLITVPQVWNDFRAEILAAAKRFDVPVELIVATICTETGGNPSAVREEPGYLSDLQTPGRVSVGLMQTLISTARDALDSAGVDRAWLSIPANAITAGTAYIAKQRFITNIDPPLVACAYNAGGVFRNDGVNNRWKTRQFPINTGNHVDRFVLWFNDVFRFFDQLPVAQIPQHSFYQDLMP